MSIEWKRFGGKKDQANDTMNAGNQGGIDQPSSRVRKLFIHTARIDDIRGGSGDKKNVGIETGPSARLAQYGFIN